MFEKIRTQKEALAFHFCWDVGDVDWYQPKSGQKVKVMALEDHYYCATPVGTTPKNFDLFVWEKIEDSLLEKYGWWVFKS